MRIFFLSDLHISHGLDSASTRFEAFLRELPKTGDALILGGDVFDLFIGDKEVFRQKFAGVISAIRVAAESGVTVYYLEGNHDFHIGAVFNGLPGLNIKTDEFNIALGGRKITVSHGDMIDPEDTGYRFLRFITRHPLFKLLIRVVPGSWIDGIGNRSSHKSREYNSAARDANQDRLRGLYLGFARAKVREGSQHVLVGHSHLRDQVLIEEDGKSGEYVNVGFTPGPLAYAVLENGAENFSIKEYP